MHISEAVENYPKLEKLLNGEFEERVWYKLINYGEDARFVEGVPHVAVYLEGVNMDKPLAFNKQEGESGFTGLPSIIYTIVNE